MKDFTVSSSLLQVLRCPLHPDAGPLEIQPNGTSLPTGLKCQDCARVFPIVDGIPDMVVEGGEYDSFREKEMRQWDEQAENYDEKRMRELIYWAGVEATVEALKPQDGDMVLDAGCGTGLTVRGYCRPSLRVVALDLSLESLKYLRKTLNHPAADFVKGDLTAVPFASDAFDKVMCSNAITQIPSGGLRRNCAQELGRVARPKGRIVVTAQNLSLKKKRAGWPKEGPARGYSGAVHYLYRYEPEEFRSLLDSSFQVETIRGAGLPLIYRFKLGWISRRLERVLRRFEGSAARGNILVGIGHKAEKH